MRAQVSIEFIYMVAAATAMIVIFTVVFSDMYNDNLSLKKSIIANDFSYSVQNEFIMAAQAKPGYRRQFIVPQTLEGFEYFIFTNKSSLVVEYTSALPLPNFTGTLVKGANLITKQNQTICLNC